MINGLEGIPGSGKSYEAVVFHVLHALKMGRKVITNLPLNVEAFGAINPDWVALIEIRTSSLPVLGTWDDQRVPAFQLFQPGQRVSVENSLYTGPGSEVRVRTKPKIFGHVWDFYSDWQSSDGAGPLFIVDECHSAMPKQGTDGQVIEWFKLHRHFNCDVLLATQSFREMNQDIAGLMAMVIKVRNADILGMKKSYIRKVHAGYRGAVISTETRKLEPQFFLLYKSHTQGNSVAESAASDVMPMMVKFNRIKYLFFVLAAVACLYAFWPSVPKVKGVSSSSAPAPPWATKVLREAADKENGVPGAVGPVAGASAAASAAVAPEVIDLEPFKEQKIHLTGWMRMSGKSVYTFAVSVGGSRFLEMKLPDLVLAGYRFEALGECSGILRWGDKVRTVICDAPVTNEGTNNAPILVADGSGRSSRD